MSTLPALWLCHGTTDAGPHVSSVVRLPNPEGVRRCFFCPAVASEIDLSNYAADAEGHQEKPVAKAADIETGEGDA